VVGADAAAHAAPDGYTLLMAAGAHTLAPSLNAKLPYDIVADFQPISLAAIGTYLLVVNPSVPARSVKELIALAKAKPLRVGVSAIASVQHLLAEMFNHTTGLKLQIVPYKGGAQVATDVVGGQIESLWSVLPVVLPPIQSGRLIAIAIASEKRSALLPKVPTMAESGWPSVVATAWNGVVAPAGTPRAIVDQVNAAIGQALRAPDITERFAAIGMEAVGGTPEEFGAFLRAETAKWAKVIKAANIKVE
jgi:tripartite-type tricarboxylate transporter receptor subunit TctC